MSQDEFSVAVVVSAVYFVLLLGFVGAIGAWLGLPIWLVVGVCVGVGGLVAGVVLGGIAMLVGVVMAYARARR